MVEIVLSIATKVSEYLVAPIGRQFGYLLCYRSYTDDLRNKVLTLRRAKDDEQISVDEARRRGNEIRPIVQDWLNRVDQIVGEAEKLLNDENNNSCFNPKSRYQLGRQAYKTAQQVINKIQEGRNFPEGISYRVPPRSATFIGYQPFESRSSTLGEIMDALRDDTVKMIGVWGMGGVGKTTLVKQVAEQAKQQNLFTTQVYVDVSWTREDAKFEEGIRDIQQHIAGMLGFQFQGTDNATRAAELRQRLQPPPPKEKQQEKEKILIILDDLWKEVNLAAGGIPSHHEGCKIVLTSRRLSVLSNEMGTQNNFQVEQLSEEEAWSLFKKTAGDHSIENNPILRKVLRKCGGLPLAIVIVAKALKGKDLATWKDALLQLTRSIETNIEGIEARIFASLEFSYNKLYGDEVKSLFLLCGLLDYGDTRINDLFKFGLGLHLFQDVDTLEARDRLHTLINNLKASSLLLESSDYDDDKYVRMHDIVRQVARAIASKDPHRFVVRENDDRFEEWSNTDEFKSCTRLSLSCSARPKLPQLLVCPQLKFFLLQCNNDLSLEIPDNCFERMEKLQVLALSNLDFSKLPSSLSSLSNIQTLCLDRCLLRDIALIGELTKLRVLSMADSHIKQLPQEMAQLTDLRLLDLTSCYGLRDIVVIGKLKQLQVLSMAHSSIRQLPQEMAQLTNLRLLDLSKCFSLRVIPRNILSSMSRLECLLMKRSFSRWATEKGSNGERNACLSELNHLPHLMAAEINIPDVESVPHEDKFFENLTSFAISIGNNFDCGREVIKTPKTLWLRGRGAGSIFLRNGMGKLLEHYYKNDYL